MTHLTVDEIIDFVSMEKINSESLELASKVNTHIKSCSECFETVKAFQLIYDEYKKIGTKESFKNSLKQNLEGYMFK